MAKIFFVPLELVVANVTPVLYHEASRAQWGFGHDDVLAFAQAMVGAGKVKIDKEQAERLEELIELQVQHNWFVNIRFPSGKTYLEWLLELGAAYEGAGLEGMDL